MQKEEYDKIATVLPMAQLIDRYMANLRTYVEDANNQAENGSQLGMAVAVGRIKSVTDDLYSAWTSVRDQ